MIKKLKYPYLQAQQFQLLLIVEKDAFIPKHLQTKKWWLHG